MSKKDDCVGCEYKNSYTRTCATCGFQWEHGRNGKHSCIEQLKQQLASAHRQGWEQAKEQIIAEWELPWGLSGGKRFEDRMRAMEYGGKANEKQNL